MDNQDRNEFKVAVVDVKTTEVVKSNQAESRYPDLGSIEKVVLSFREEANKEQQQSTLCSGERIAGYLSRPNQSNDWPTMLASVLRVLAISGCDQRIRIRSTATVGGSNTRRKNVIKQTKVCETGDAKKGQ